MFLDRLNRLPKPLVFAMLAAIGALAGALVAELLPLSDQRIYGDDTPQGAPSVISFSTKMQKRLDREGAEAGEIELALSWDNANDIDLHCICPDGDQISFEKKLSDNGGELDVDMNVNYDPDSTSPVEHIRWLNKAAPYGEYKVYVRHYRRHVENSDPTDYTVEMKWGGDFKRIKGSLTHKKPTGNYGAGGADGDLTLVHTFEHTKPVPPGAFKMICLVALWTGLLATGLTLAVIVGQNHYLRRPMLTRREALVGGARGLGAGLAAGAVSEVFFLATTNAPLYVVELGRVLGWSILGGLLGFGMAIFVDNLKRPRAMAGGAVGGAVGATGFIVIGILLGDIAGRPFGAAIVGFFIGAMIAIVDLLFREAWLEIHYGPNEMRTVGLGKTPVVIGADRSQCTVLARGSAAIAYRYTLLEGVIFCEDPQSGTVQEVPPGHRQTAGTIEIVVCGIHPTPVATDDDVGVQVIPDLAPIPATTPPPLPVSSAGFHLRIRGRRIRLAAGARLSNNDISGLETLEADGAVAEVTTHPSDPSLTGLKNLAQLPWQATMPDGAAREVAPGKSLRIVAGTKIDFGVLKGIIDQ